MKNSEIPILCFTNRDVPPGVVWPSTVCCRPIIGDRIISLCGGNNLKIVGVTHCKHNKDSIPYLKVELNL